MAQPEFSKYFNLKMQIRRRFDLKNFDSSERYQSAKSCRYTYVDQSIKTLMNTQMSAGQRTSLFQLFHDIAFTPTFILPQLPTSFIYT
ncbi:hypothetical protein ACTXT7_006556 [Hymenolepis weldensis]